MTQPVTIPKEYQGNVINKQELYENVFFLQVDTGQSVTFKTGQYASFLIRDIRRPYSFACSAGKSIIDFIVGTREQGTTHDYIQQLQVGDRLKFLAPYGRFVFDGEDTRAILFIAGGTGIAPIRAQLQMALSAGLTQPIKLYFAHRDEARLFLSQEFSALAKKYQNFEYVPVLSKAGETWAGKRGRVTTIIPTDIENLSEYTAYVCGSPAMVTDTVAMLQKQGVPKEQIHFEQFT